MNGATLVCTAWSSAFQTLLARAPPHVSWLAVLRLATIKIIVAFGARAPDHSRSRSDSLSSPEHFVGVVPDGTTVVVIVLAGSPAALRKLLRSVGLIALCPITAIFCP